MVLGAGGTDGVNASSCPMLSLFADKAAVRLPVGPGMVKPSSATCWATTVPVQAFCCRTDIPVAALRMASLLLKTATSMEPPVEGLIDGVDAVLAVCV